MNIGVFFGSRSPEHDVSIITAELIISGLKKLGLKATPVYLSKKGEWLIGESLDKLKTFTNEAIQLSPSLKQYFIDLEKSVGKIIFKNKKIFGKEIIIDLAFPAFHGSFGEDGTMQGLFEMFNLPYVGCDVASSAIAMDKILTKLYLKTFGFPTTDFIYFSRNDWQKDKKTWLIKILKEFQLPVFVKPSKLGSSIGITKVLKPEELENAIDVALHYDLRCLIEKSVENLSDLTCALIGNDNPIPSLLQESMFSRDLFSYEDKYLNEGGSHLGQAKSKICIPADLNPVLTKKIQAMAVNIYRSFGLSGTSRIDFLLDRKTSRFYANEINPLPGTLYSHLWEKSGLKLPQLLEKLIVLAEEKFEEKNSVIYTFKSDILKSANSIKLQIKK